MRWYAILAALFLNFMVVTAASASTPEVPDIIWTSPKTGDQFSPGQTIVATWQAPEKVVSPSFALCVEDNGSDDCGASVWPSVAESSLSDSSYSMSIIAPNITSQGSFFIKMKSDMGDLYTSPDFALAPSGAIVANTTSITPSLAVSTSGSLPSATSTIPPVNPKRTNPLAIGIPLTMLIMAFLGALAFCLTRSRRQQRDAGGPASMAPSVATTASNYSNMPVKGKLDGGESTFFNISLNKTGSELSEVEKAVCGAISSSASTIPPRPPPNRRAELRMPLDDDREYYTVPPPRTWQRDRSRNWVSKKQRQRARERELDWEWEADRREKARRRYQESLPPYTRSYEEDHCYSAQSAPEPRRHMEREPDNWYPYREHQRQRPPSPPARYHSHSPSAGYYQDGNRISRPPTTRPREHAASAMRSEPEHHSSLSVVSAYCTASPYISTASGFPTSPYMPPFSPPPIREIPISLQAGRTASSRDPYFPPGLDRERPREYASSRAGHPSFEFEQRQESQFRFNDMGPSPSSGSRRRYEEEAMYRRS